MINNFGFHSSKIEDSIYGLMEDYMIGSDLYDFNICDIIENYFINELHREYQLFCSPWPDMTGGVCAVSWVEGCYPKMIMFDYKKGVLE